jgi:SPIRAL1-like protein
MNCDNFIGERSSTRLHAPPGGGSSVGSLIFGGGSTESPFAGHEKRTSMIRRKEETPESAFAGYERKSNFQTPQSQHPSYNAPAAGSRQMSSNQYANGSNQNAGNVLTDRRITRIHAPPGGASSFRLG